MCLNGTTDLTSLVGLYLYNNALTGTTNLATRFLHFDNSIIATFFNNSVIFGCRNFDVPLNKRSLQSTRRLP